MIRHWLKHLIFAASSMLLVCSLAAQATQSFVLPLVARDVFNQIVFDYGPDHRIDYTPAQTGPVHTDALETAGGVRRMLQANPALSAAITYTRPTGGVYEGNGVASVYLANDSLSLTLPGGNGTGGQPITWNGLGSAMSLTGVANNAGSSEVRSLSFAPRNADIQQFAYLMPAAQPITVANPPSLVSKIDLLADNLFKDTYYGNVPLPGLQSLVITAQHPQQLTMTEAPSILLIDPTGNVFDGLSPPDSISLEAFDSLQLMLAFDAPMNVSIERADYASQADFDAAVSWLAGSGVQRVFSRQVAVWVSEVPEPGSWALMLLGLVAIGVGAARRRSLLLLAAALLSPVVAVQAAAGYRITTIDHPDAVVSTQLWDINDAGVIVGEFSTETSTFGFVLDASGFRTVAGPAGSTQSYVTGITNAGLLVGTAHDAQGVARGFLYDGAGYTNFELDGALETSIRHVSSDGRYLTGGMSLSATDGYVFDRQEGALTRFGAFSILQGVNVHGVAVGSTTTQGLVHDTTTATTTLIDQVLDFAAAPRFRDINDQGLMTGFAGDRAFIGSIGDFSEIDIEGATSVFGYGLDNLGRLVGFYDTEDGLTHGFLATPVPEPTTGLLLSAGAVGVFWLHRRRHPVV